MWELEIDLIFSTHKTRSNLGQTFAAVSKGTLMVNQRFAQSTTGKDKIFFALFTH
jgi:hypothetical protein